MFAPNMATLLAFRFFSGFVGSPALATGGATMGDIFPPHRLPYVIGLWAFGAISGPITGPIIVCHSDSSLTECDADFDS